MTDQLTWTPPEIEIEGKTYQLRRLGILDVFKLGKIWASAQARAGALMKVDMTPEAVGMLLVSMLPLEGDAIIEFLADAIGVKADNMRDPNQFPLGSEVQIIEALLTHEDVAGFFERVLHLAGNEELLKMVDRLANRSTSSKGKQAGGTKKS